jgi:hypothetical protein
MRLPVFRCAASLLVFASSVSLAAAGDAGAGPEAATRQAECSGVTIR